MKQVASMPWATKGGSTSWISAKAGSTKSKQNNYANLLLATLRHFVGYRRFRRLRPRADFEACRAGRLRENSGWLRGEADHAAKFQGRERTDHFLRCHHQGTA